MHAIQKLTPQQTEQARDELVDLLQNAVHNGASVGFLSPLPREIARQYWQDVSNDIRQGSRVLLVLRNDGQVVGSVQLDLCMRERERCPVSLLIRKTEYVRMRYRYL